MISGHLSRRSCVIGSANLFLSAAVLDRAGSAKAAIESRTSNFTRPSSSVPVAVLLDTGATVIDFAGPWEVFQDAEDAASPGFRPYTVAPNKQLLHATGDLLVMPQFDFSDAPLPKVLVIGAQGGHENQAKLEWIRRAAFTADIVMSVCTGAFLLAKTGLIDGLLATTHHDFYDKFERDFPNIHLVRGRRFVDNGKFVSSGGLTSGIDASLHIVSRYYGNDAANKLSKTLEHSSTGWLTGLQGK